MFVPAIDQFYLNLRSWM